MNLALRSSSILAICGMLMIPTPLNSAEVTVPQVHQEELPMVYEYFRNSSENVGLVAEADGFKLNGKPLKIFSGALHYYRVHPSLWRDRLKKLRAMGANAVETYVAWNLHEPRMGEFDWGNGTDDMSMFANLRQFLQIAQEEDLLVLFRPGPYICTEWEFGGFPSWLLRDPDMQVRTAYQPYLDRVKIYFDQLLPHIADLLWTRGGSIIGIQIENEYGFFNPKSPEYLQFLVQLFEDHGFSNEALFFTSDGVGSGTSGSLPGLLLTANFCCDVDGQFAQLKELQPDKPTMAMEVYTASSDYWFQNHHVSAPDFVDAIDGIVGRWNGSVNLYMFHGGTNFGFMVGANIMNEEPYYHSDVTSYDLDGPLSEAGDYTTKYTQLKDIFELHQEPRIRQTEMIPESIKRAYPTVALERYLTYDDLIGQVPASSKIPVASPVSMENLPINSGNGQSYGYIVYRKVADISNGTDFEAGPVKDFGMLLVDGELLQTGFNEANYWMNSVQNYALSVSGEGQHTLDLFIENTARVNFVDFDQPKGLVKGHAYKLNGEDIRDLEIIALEFKSAWVQNLSSWRQLEGVPVKAPVLLETTFEIQAEPADTFLDMSAWHKGIVFVNDFNIGRYWKVGPQQALYIPAPLLKQGTNKISVFEQLEPAVQLELVFREEPNLGPVTK